MLYPVVPARSKTAVPTAHSMANADVLVGEVVAVVTHLSPFQYSNIPMSTMRTKASIKCDSSLAGRSTKNLPAFF